MYTTKFKQFGKFCEALTKYYFQVVMWLYPLKLLLLWTIQTLQGSLTDFVPYGNVSLRYLCVGVFTFWVFFYWSSYVHALLCSSSTLAVEQWLELFKSMQGFQFFKQSIQLRLAHLQVGCWTRWTWVILSDLNYSIILLIVWIHQIWTEVLFCGWSGSFGIVHWRRWSQTLVSSVLDFEQTCLFWEEYFGKAIKNIAVVPCQRDTVIIYY